MSTEQRTFGFLLAHYRTRSKISQAKFAELVDFDHSYISRLESGQRMPTIGAVDRLTKALNLNPDDTMELNAAANFVARGGFVVHFKALYEIDALLRDPDLPKELSKAFRQELGWIRQQLTLIIDRTAGETEHAA